MKYFVLLALAVLVLSISACAELQGLQQRRKETVPEELPPSETGKYFISLIVFQQV